MAAPTFVAAGTASAATATSVTPSYPGGVAADDIALYYGIIHGTNVRFSEPSGWTSIVHNGSPAAINASIWWRRLTGSESGTVSCAIAGTIGVALAQIAVFRGCIVTGTPYEGYDSTSPSSTTTWTSPSTTTTGPERLGVRIFAINDDQASTPPAGWDERAEPTTTTGTDAALAVDTKELASAGTEAASARTLAGSASGFIRGIALLPVTYGIVWDPQIALRHILVR